MRGNLKNGYGVFTTFLAEETHSISRLDAHFTRLKRDCTFFNLELPWKEYAQFAKFVEILLETLLPGPTVIRVTVRSQEIAIVLRPKPLPSNGVKACLLTYDRPFPLHKHTGILAEATYLQTSQKRGFDDFIRISEEGFVTEAAHANLFIVFDERTLLTPALETGCLPGTTREWVLTDSKAVGFLVKEGHYSPEILKTARVFFYATQSADFIRWQRLKKKLMTLNSPNRLSICYIFHIFDLDNRERFGFYSRELKALS